jgi:hypothetical protein
MQNLLNWYRLIREKLSSMFTYGFHRMSAWSNVDVVLFSSKTSSAAGMVLR